MSDPAISATERWFLKRGLPHFIDDYSPTRDVLTRAVPLLTLIFLVEVANAHKRDFPIWLDVVAVAVGFAILLGAWMLANRIRGRPLLARPESVGVFEVAVFVLAPPAIPLVFGGQWRSAVATAVSNLLLLAVIFLGTSYGVVPMTRWAGGRTIREVEQVMSLLVRALPLLILYHVHLPAERSLADHGRAARSVLLDRARALRRNRDRLLGHPAAARDRRASDFESWNVVVVGRVVGTPAAPLVDEVADATQHDPPPLSRRQWGNVALVVLFSQALQVILVSTMVFVFLFVFGVLVVTEPVARGFTDSAPNVLATLDLCGRQMVVTEELVRVTGFLTVFAGLYFTVTAITDESYRKEFIGEILDEMRRPLAVRTVYLGALSSAAVPGRRSTLSST